MLRQFWGEKFLSPVEMGPKNGGFGKNGGVNLRYWFRDPQKRTSLRGKASSDVFGVKIGACVSAVAFLKNPKIAESLCAKGREITHAQNRNP